MGGSADVESDERGAAASIDADMAFFSELVVAGGAVDCTRTLKRRPMLV